MTGWRTQIHSWSRNGRLLKKLALIISAGGFFLAWLIIAVTPEPGHHLSADPEEQRLRQTWQELSRAEQPHKVVRWIHQVASQIQHLSLAVGQRVTTWESYQEDGILAGYETSGLLERHAQDPATRQLWRDFIQAELTREVGLIKSLEEKALQEPPPITANLVHYYLLDQRVPQAALAALMREGTAYPEASEVRQAAFYKAIAAQDVPVLRQIIAEPEWWSQMPPEGRHRAAALTGDWRLQWKAILSMNSLVEASWGTLVIALLAAGVWYILLVLHGVSGPWRWVAPLLPLLAGIFSIWPVIFLDSWQEIHQGMRADAPFPHDLWYQIGGVGMREELSKLCFATLFMPWLLHRRAAGGALMVGAFVGLGFALEENINYYLMHEGGIAFTRLLTANFFHASLTGISTHALYQLLRSKFGTADRFLITLLLLIVGHGCYNFSGSSSLQDQGYIGMIILAFTVWHFLDLVDHECPRPRQLLTPAAVFLVGIASVMAAVFLSIAFRTPDRQILVAAAVSCISLFPVVFIYWRRLESDVRAR